MKMKRFTLLALIMAGMFAFVSCEKDDTKDLSKDESEQQITIAEQDFQTKSTEIAATEGYQIQAYYGQMPSPFVGKTLTAKSEIPSVAQKMLDVVRSNSLLQNEIEFYYYYFLIENFNDVTGTWTWNPDTQWYDHTSTPTDEVIVKFPYPESSTTNNVTVTYYDFTSTSLDGETVPNGLKVKIEYNGNQVFTLAYTGSFTDWYKYSYKIDVAFGQFTISEEESYDESDTDFRYVANFIFKKDGKTFYSENLNYTATLLTDQSVKFLVTGTQVIGNLEFRMKLEGNSADIETGDPNDFLSLSLYTTGGDKVGDFVFVEENYEWVIYFKFNTGEQELAETLMPEISELLSDFISNMFYY